MASHGRRIRLGGRLGGCAGVADCRAVRVVQTVDRLAIGPGDQVAVGVDRERDAVVAELVTDVGQGLALLDQERAEPV